MQDERDELPVLMVTDIDNYIIAVGDPAQFSGRDLKYYIKDGYNIKTVKFKEYINCGLKWIFDKEKTETTQTELF